MFPKKYYSRLCFLFLLLITFSVMGSLSMASPDTNIALISPFRVNSTITAGYNTYYHGGNDNNRADLMTLDLAPANGGSWGTEVVAAASGEVWYTGSCSVVLRHGDLNLFTSYLHVQPQVTQGNTVSAGQTIATLQPCGIQSGPHVHFMLNSWRGSGEARRQFPYRGNWQAEPFESICTHSFPYGGDSQGNQHYGGSVNTCNPTIFADVSLNDWAVRWIEQLYREGITTGCARDPLRYCPEMSINRLQMAIFLLRLKHGSDYEPPPASVIFSDVTLDHSAIKWIEQLYREGITTGCGRDPLRYCPEMSVNRLQIAVFLLRIKHGNGYEPPAASGIFSDLAADHWATKWIEQFYREGITAGCASNPLRYCPKDNVTRAQMAILLLRTKYGSDYQP